MHTWERTARLQSYAGSGSTQDKLMLYNRKLLLKWLQIWMWQIPALPFHMFQKAFPGKLKPALSGTHRYSLFVKKTAAAFILHLAIAEWLSYDISSCLLLWIDKDAQICRDITGALILWFFFPFKCFSLWFAMHSHRKYGFLFGESSYRTQKWVWSGRAVQRLWIIKTFFTPFLLSLEIFQDQAENGEWTK